ncbi:hypothetical protein LQF76_08480 [Gloeomargaritales cyanobacterium VI4D9]|nr:hypothetical protein LQF76_08480 [Gloeomargaritales cyanobacterium VI4D9]
MNWWEQELSGVGYRIYGEPEPPRLVFEGSLRLNGMAEYQPLTDWLGQIVAAAPPQMILDVRSLKFLNSSGINVLSRFVIQVRQKGNIHLTVRCNDGIPWQHKSLVNLQRLLPTLDLDFCHEF